MTIPWQQLWFRVSRMGFVVFAGVVIFGVAVMFLPLIHHRLSLQAEMDRLYQEIARQEQLEKKQKTEIEGLRTDASFVERTARDKLNLARDWQRR